MPLLTPRDHYRPFEFPWAFEAYNTQNKVHWLPEEVPLHEDVRDWNGRLTAEEKGLISQILRFFTQADIDVAGGYIDRFLPAFKPPEIRMMMSTFAAMESIHIHAYSLLIDTIGMPESEYQAFAEYKAMREKHEYMHSQQEGTDLERLALDLATFSAFGEGMQLFSSFVILLSFPKRGLLKGAGQIVSWSVRDESLHVESMIKVFHTLMDEHPELWSDAFKKRIYQTAREMVRLEDAFIDLAFKEGDIEGLTAADVKKYIRYIADRRLLQLGLKPNWRVSQNPLPWVEYMISGVEHANFFEARATEYSKGALTGNWDDAF